MNKPKPSRTIFWSCLIFLLGVSFLTARYYYVEMLKGEETQEMWHELGFLTYPNAKSHIANGVDINSRGNEGATFLMIASQFGYKDSVKVLVALGANMNTRDNAGRTTLDYAAEAKEPAITKFLKKHGSHN